MTAPNRYGQRKVSKMIREWDAHRQACRAEGTPAIQATLDAMEEHIDYAYRATPAAMPPEVRKAVLELEQLANRLSCGTNTTRSIADSIMEIIAALRAGGDG